MLEIRQLAITFRLSSYILRIAPHTKTYTGRKPSITLPTETLWSSRSSDDISRTHGVVLEADSPKVREYAQPWNKATNAMIQYQLDQIDEKWTAMKRALEIARRPFWS
jgi:hypothetical protein